MDKRTRLPQGCFSGRKLLILGASTVEIPLVERARELGCHTIVTDSNVDWDISPAKYAADEAWDVSWSDLDALESLCRRNGIEGVLAGYSEVRVDNLIALCGRLGLPCYCTKDQLEITRSKVRFKEACRAYGVPVVREFDGVVGDSDFPVIVKPVDRGGSMGISVARNQEELGKAVDYARETSLTGEVIVEQYIEDRIKIDALYVIQDGRIVLMGVCDTVDAASNGGKRVVQSGWTFPSKHYASYVEQIDPFVRGMIGGLGLRWGFVFFSGFALEGGFAFFEAGYRLSGGESFLYYDAAGKGNVFDLYIAQALGSELGAKIAFGEPSDLKCASVNYYAKPGIVSEIEGVEEMKRSMPECVLALRHGRSGQECFGGAAILPKMAMIHFVSKSSEVLRRCVGVANRTVRVVSADGEDLIYDRPDASRFTWID